MIKRYEVWLIIILLIVVGLGCLWVLLHMMGNGPECMKDPITYLYRTQNISCYCT